MRNKRVCFVELEIKDQNETKKMKRLDGLTIRGTVSRKAGQTQAEAKVQVFNLTKSTIEYLTTFSSPYFKPQAKKKINIYAGYEESGWGRIFSGDITKAIPTGMPDIILNIEAQSLNADQRTPISYSASDITAQDLGQSIANQLGLNYDWQATSTNKIPLFDFLGSKRELIKEFNNLENITMFEDNGTLKVVDKSPVIKNTNQAKLINQNSGLIGEVEPDEYGIKFRCLIDPSMNCGGWVKTESVKLPSTNGFYQIYTLDFDFSSRDEQFYCNVYAKAGKQN